MWFSLGAAATTLRGDCQDCEQPGAFLHAASVLAGVGRRVTSRMDYGVEFIWVPTSSNPGAHIRSTFFVAAAQFRPWDSRGFFLKTGMGMTFVRNWIYDGTGTLPPVTSKALGLTYSAGWRLPPARPRRPADPGLAACRGAGRFPDRHDHDRERRGELLVDRRRGRDPVTTARDHGQP